MFKDKESAKEVIEAVVRAVKEPFPEKTVVIAGYSDYERLGTISPFDISPLADTPN